MGSGQSARKLTISNEEEVGVIKVSNAIVQRLAQGERTRAREPSPSDTRPGAPIQHPAPPSATTVAPQAGEAPAYYYPELTISALKMQQQMEEELKRQDQYWQRRLRNLEDGYQKVNRILEDEYKRVANETSKPGEFRYCLTLSTMIEDKNFNNHILALKMASLGANKKLIEVGLT